MLRGYCLGMREAMLIVRSMAPRRLDRGALAPKSNISPESTDTLSPHIVYF